MANKFRNTKTLKDAYKLYKQDYSGNIEYSIYAYIIKAFNKKLMDKIFYEAFEFEMPYRLGSLRIKKTKTWFNTKTMKVDWKKTKEIGKRVYHMNEHTNYFNFRFFWKKKAAVFTNKSIYSFTASRDNKRKLSSILKDKNRTVDYYE